MAFIYKYYRINTLNLNSLKKGEVYLTHPSSFNDPFDSIVNAKANDEEILRDISNFLIEQDPENEEHYSFGSLKLQWGAWKEDDPNQALVPHFTDSLKYLSTDMPKQFDKYKKRSVESKSSFSTQLKRYFEIMENIGVCSFSEIFNSESMWAYYADNHKGICVEFEVKSKPSAPMLMDSVAYVDGDEYIEMNGATDEEIIARSLFKKRCWNNEKEIRLVHPKKANVCIPFPGKIKSIIFGAFTPVHEIDLVKDIFELTGIVFYKMRTDYGTKAILRSRIDEF